MGGGVNSVRASSSEPALQPGTVVTLGGALCRALGLHAFSAKQGPHLPWQLMYQLVFCMDTLLATGGNTQLYFWYVTVKSPYAPHTLQGVLEALSQPAWN